MMEGRIGSGLEYLHKERYSHQALVFKIKRNKDYFRSSPEVDIKVSVTLKDKPHKSPEISNNSFMETWWKLGCVAIFFAIFYQFSLRNNSQIPNTSIIARLKNAKVSGDAEVIAGNQLGLKEKVEKIEKVVAEAACLDVKGNAKVVASLPEVFTEKQAEARQYHKMYANDVERLQKELVDLKAELEKLQKQEKELSNELKKEKDQARKIFLSEEVIEERKKIKDQRNRISNHESRRNDMSKQTSQQLLGLGGSDSSVKK